MQFGDNYERLGLEAFAADAALQCMPNDVSPYVVFYNKRLLACRDAWRLPGETAADPETGLVAGSSSFRRRAADVARRRQGRLPRPRGSPR